jgi:hypothetical protein
MAAAGMGLRRLVSQGIVAPARLEQPADVVRRLGAVQAQDYNQSLWAIGARLRAGTAALVERAIEERRILRTWLLRGTIHYALPEDVRWLLAVAAPRLATAEARRCHQLGLTEAHFERAARVLREALAGDRRLSRPEVMRLLEDAGIETGGQRGYHVLVRLAREALICLGPLQGRQQTFVLLDDWAPRARSRDLSHDEALALLAARFAGGRGPVREEDYARWAGIALGEARRGLSAAEGLAARTFDGVEYRLASARSSAAVPRAGRKRAYLLAGFDEYLLGYKHRDDVLAPDHAGRIAPGANGVFRPLIVVDGQIAGTWARSVRAGTLTLTLHPFAPSASLVEQVRAEALRYRDFLGLGSEPVLRCEAPAPRSEGACTTPTT